MIKYFISIVMVFSCVNMFSQSIFIQTIRNADTAGMVYEMPIVYTDYSLGGIELFNFVGESTRSSRFVISLKECFDTVIITSKVINDLKKFPDLDSYFKNFDTINHKLKFYHYPKDSNGFIQGRFYYVAYDTLIIQYGTLKDSKAEGPVVCNKYSFDFCFSLLKGHIKVEFGGSTLLFYSKGEWKDHFLDFNAETEKIDFGTDKQNIKKFRKNPYDSKNSNKRILEIKTGKTN